MIPHLLLLLLCCCGAEDDPGVTRNEKNDSVPYSQTDSGSGSRGKQGGTRTTAEGTWGNVMNCTKCKKDSSAKVEPRWKNQ